MALLEEDFDYMAASRNLVPGETVFRLDSFSGDCGKMLSSGHSGGGNRKFVDKMLPNGKKTKGRVKIKMEFIDNKLRRYTTFSKRKTGIMKKAYELSTLTGTQVMLLVASETGHVYTFATKKLQPMITSEAGKALIQTCLNTPTDGNDIVPSSSVSPGFYEDSPGSNASKPKKSKLSLQNDEQMPTSGAGLPTMVAASSAFGGYEDDDESDEEYDDDPIPVDDGEEESESGAASEEGNGSNVQQLSLQHELLLRAAGMLPQSSNQQNMQQALGLMQGLTSQGTFMYQMPQGVVYAPSGGEANTNGGLIFNFPPQNQEASESSPQQYITIPLGFQQVGANGTTTID